VSISDISMRLYSAEMSQQPKIAAAPLLKLSPRVFNFLRPFFTEHLPR